MSSHTDVYIGGELFESQLNWEIDNIWDEWQKDSWRYKSIQPNIKIYAFLSKDHFWSVSYDIQIKNNKGFFLSLINIPTILSGGLEENKLKVEEEIAFLVEKLK